jgi:hypothetical protein
VHTEEFQRLEFDIALRHAAPELWVIDSSGRELGVLRRLCERHKARFEYFLERPRRHFYKPPGTSVAVFRAAGSEGDPGPAGSRSG